MLAALLRWLIGLFRPAPAKPPIVPAPLPPPPPPEPPPSPLPSAPGTYRSLLPGGFFATPADKSLPVSIRMNNPGAVNGASWEKQMPGYVNTVETTPGNRTTIFEAPEYGVAVWWELMRKYNAAGADTVGEIVTRYGGGQDYSDYLDAVTRQTGLTAGEHVDLDDNKRLLIFAKAMFRVEAGRPTPLKDEQIIYGFVIARSLASGGGTKPAPVPTPQPTPAVSGPAWMAVAKKYLGFHEKGENLGIEHFIELAHCGSLGDAWCSIFCCAVLEEAGIPGTRSAMARSFEHHPEFVRLPGPALGAITTMWRESPDSGLGHVYLYVGTCDRGIVGLGGNQSDQVCMQLEPEPRVIGYYWPRSVPLPKIGAIHVPNDSAKWGREV